MHLFLVSVQNTHSRIFSMKNNKYFKINCVQRVEWDLMEQ